MLEKMLIEFGMKDVPRIFRSFPSQLSGGMLQKIDDYISFVIVSQHNNCR